MDLNKFTLPQLFQADNEVSKIMQCSKTTQTRGLQLSEPQAVALLGSCSKSLKSAGRIALSPITESLIEAFYTSPYISPQNYFETLTELTELFYLYKNETLDAVPDDTLITFMREQFDGVCQGSLELLRDRELYNLARAIRFGEATVQKNILVAKSVEIEEKDVDEIDDDLEGQV